MPEFPRLKTGNAAVLELEAWLQSEREKCRGVLENDSDQVKLLRTQGRAGLIRELLQNIDPNHRRYGERD